MSNHTKKLTVLALLSAIAYLVMVVGRVPVVLFLKYDPKDAIIVISGFLFGPLSAFAVSATVSVIEMLTVSETGPIGLVMNIISTCAFACTASFIYKKKHSMSGAVVGLAAGALLATAAMLLWNYLITPLYMNVPRQVVAGMLMSAFLPFNLLKGGLNSAIAMIIYKPVRLALNKSRLVAAPENGGQRAGKLNVGVIAISLFVIATCVLVIIVMQGLL